MPLVYRPSGYLDEKSLGQETIGIHVFGFLLFGQFGILEVWS